MLHWKKTDNIATHILAFIIRSIVNPFKFSLANFTTSGASARQMFSVLWRIISICEQNSLKVLTVTCYGASPNRKLLKLHFPMTKEDDVNPDFDVTYKTINFFSKEKRLIYLFYFRCATLN